MKTRTIAGIAVVLGMVLTGCSTEAVTDLKVGDCFNYDYSPTGETQEIWQVPTVDCSKEHTAEVFLTTDLDSTGITSWDEDEVFLAGVNVCIDAFEGYVGTDFWASEVGHLDVSLIFPLEAEWNQGERGIICVILPVDPTEDLTGSMKGAYAAG